MKFTAATFKDRLVESLSASPTLAATAENGAPSPDSELSAKALESSQHNLEASYQQPVSASESDPLGIPDLMQELQPLKSRLDHVSQQQDAVCSQLQALNLKLDTLLSRLDVFAIESIKRQNKLDAGLKELSRTAATLDAALYRLKPPIGHGGENVLFTEVDGFILGIPGEEWRLAAYYAFRGLLETGVTRLIQRSIHPGMTFIDVGANIGIYTLYAARLVGEAGKVFSFEPTPRTFGILKDNIQVNGLLETGRIDFQQIAISDRRSTMSLHVYRNDSGHNTFYPDGRDCDTILVEAAPLDEIIRPGAKVDFIHIDAEGAEPLILRGMSRILKENPEVQIVMEFAPMHLRRASTDPGGFLDEIGGLGFQITRIDDLTGELLPFDREQLITTFSTNLSLKR